ncbi:MAG: site-specific integrase [Alphaproteobacteria bacterium]
MPDLSRDEIDRLTREHFRQTMMSLADINYCIRHDTGYDRAAEIASARQTIDDRTQEYLNGSPSDRTRTAAQDLLDDDKHGGVPRNGEGIEKLCEGLLRADKEAFRIFIAMLSGDQADTVVKDALFDGIDPTALPALPGDEEDGDAAGDTISVLAAVNKFCDEKVTSGAWLPKTHTEMRRAYDVFITLVGPKKVVSALEQSDIREYREVLMRLPPNMAKIKRYADVPVRQIAKENTGRKLGNRVQHKQFTYTCQFIRWCMDQGYLKTDIIGGLKIAQKKNGETDRRPYAVEQLEAIFQGPVHTGCLSRARRNTPGKYVFRDSKYWVPLIGLYTGMRLGEIVQLLASDIRVADGVTYIDVNKGLDRDEDGKRLKTENAVRQVPVHSQLVTLGFVKFVEEARAAGADSRLFPEVQPGKDGDWSQTFSKWWGRYTRAIEVHKPGTVFHSFRHNYTAALRKARVEDSRMKALLGHAGSTTTDGYGVSEHGLLYEATDLADDVERVSYHLDLSHLTASKDGKAQTQGIPSKLRLGLRQTCP